MRFQNTQTGTVAPPRHHVKLSALFGFPCKSCSYTPAKCLQWEIGKSSKYRLCARLSLSRTLVYLQHSQEGPRKAELSQQGPSPFFRLLPYLASPPRCSVDIASVSISQSAAQGSEFKQSCNIWLFIPRSDYELLEVLRIHLLRWGPQRDPISFFENQ